MYLWLILLFMFSNSTFSQIGDFERISASGTQATKEKQIEEEKAEQKQFRYISGDSDFSVALTFRPEYFYLRNLFLLNNNNPTDADAYPFFTFDFISSYSYGHASSGYNVITMFLDIRSQGAWGDVGLTLETTEFPVRYLNTLVGHHVHDMRQFTPWIRELWISASLSELLCLPFCNRHVINIGAFPFQLGRGIALGVTRLRSTAQRSVASLFFIREYNFGISLSGILIKDKLIYDLYGSIITNRSDLAEYINKPVKENIVGFRRNPRRGFGSIDYVIAARLRYTPIKETEKKPYRSIYVEPYALYAYNPELPFEFDADFVRDLVTVGTASEFQFGRLGFGFDCAFNLGKEVFKPTDRNFLTPGNFGFEAIINTEVLESIRSFSVNALDTPENRALINNSAQNTQQNGQVIGRNNLAILTNSATRFRNTLQFTLHGSMFVFDIGYLLIDPSLQINGSIGFASGGLSNACQVVPENNIFVGIDENYFGVRVKSIFVPLAVSPFTNIFSVGTGLNINPQTWCRKWIFNPNFVAYWKDSPLLAFDRIKQTDSFFNARQYMGFEVNLLSEVELIKNFKFFTLIAAFFPGFYFKDISGRPINPLIEGTLNILKRNDIKDRILRQGHDIGYIIDLGFQYFF